MKNKKLKSAKNPWFRLYHEFATDLKIQMLSEADQRRYVMLLCLRCSNGDETLHDSQIAFHLRISEQDWETTKKRFIDLKLIDSCNKITNWEKRQYLSDSSTARVREYRERKKQECNVSVTASNGCETVSVTSPETETDTEIIKTLLSSDDEVTPLSPSRGGTTRGRRSVDTVPYQEIVDQYNRILSAPPYNRPHCRLLDDKRKRLIKRIWDMSDKTKTLEWWEAYWQACTGNSHWMYGTKHTGGTWAGANLDFLLHQDRFKAVVEG